MAITTGHTQVLTTPVQIDGTSTNYSQIRIFNASNDKTVYIGNHEVTINNGYGLTKLDQFDFELHPGESLFVVAEAPGATVQWIRQSMY